MSRARGLNATGICVTVLLVALWAVPQVAADWNFYVSRHYRFYYANSAGKTIAAFLAKSSQYGVEPFQASRRLIGNNGIDDLFRRRYPDGKIRVYLHAEAQYNYGDSHTNSAGQYRQWDHKIHLWGVRC